METVKGKIGKVKQQLPESQEIMVAFISEKITRERHSALDEIHGSDIPAPRQRKEAKRGSDGSRRPKEEGGMIERKKRIRKERGYRQTEMNVQGEGAFMGGPLRGHAYTSCRERKKGK